jgi:MGT family glycosyltransferase
MNLFLALGDTLARRGHRITFFGISGNEAKIRDAGFDFHSTEPDDLPRGTLDKMMREMGDLGSFKAMRLQGRFDELRYEVILQKGPELVTRAKLDGLIVDQAEACSGSVADATGLPWVSVANGLCMNSEPLVPPFFTSWSYSANWFAIARNRLAYAGIQWASKSIAEIINRHRKRWGLKPFARLDDTFSPFAQIAQQNRDFDFPRRELPNCFHYVGPIRAPSRPAVAFPWERLDGRPLIYASFGTLVNRHKHLYRTVAESCAGLDAQLVISLGGGAGHVNELAGLHGRPLVVEFAPQLDLLSHAVLAITHGGLNTTLECLSAGVPLVAIPIAFEQPGVAARIRWTGTGEFVTLRNVTPERLRAAIVRVLGEARYRESAVHMRLAIARTGGSAQAAGIIEEVIHTRKPVLRLDGKYALDPGGMRTN